MTESPIARLLMVGLVLFTGAMGGFAAYDRLQQSEFFQAMPHKVTQPLAQSAEASPLRWSGGSYVAIKEPASLTLVQVRGALVPVGTLLK